MSESEQIRKMKAEAREHFDAIKEGNSMASKGSMMVGYHAYIMKSGNQFGVLGFSTEDEARKDAGVGESTWYAMIRLAGFFVGITEKQFVSMKQANAKSLADMPESKRLSSEWIRRAAVEKIEDFAKDVDRELNGKAKASDTKEKSTVLKLDMPASRKAVIEEKAKVYAEQHGIELGDVGKAVEMALVETTDGPTLINAITNALQRAKKCKDIIFGNYSAAEALGKVGEELDGMILDFEAALIQKENEAEEIPT